MTTIAAIIIHCSATKAGQDLRAKDIDRMHRARGFNQIGYNFVIDLDGIVENGRPLSIDGAHCNTKGFSGLSYNKHSIGICYIGGLDANGKPADTRTEAQKNALRNLVAKLCKEYPIIELLPIWTAVERLNRLNTSKHALASMYGASSAVSYVTL